VPELERDDATLPEPMRAIRWIAIDGEVCLGFAEAYRPAAYFDTHKWMLQIGVLPEHRGRGVGRQLHDAAWAYVRQEGVSVISTRVKEEDPASLAFATERGFSEINRDFESLLELQRVDEAQMNRMVARIGEIELVPFSKLDSAEFRLVFHELFEDVRRDIPRPEPPVRLTFDFFQRQVIEDPLFLRDGSFVALDAGAPVGLSGVYQGANEGWVDQWLTAVQRSHRGRGIAQALKAKTVLWSKEAGYTTLRTDNNSANAAMLSINDRFGFKRSAAILTMRKEVTG
jgi:GNAT superfamily N-acetyltransferase